MISNSLLSVGLLLFLCYLGGRLANGMRLPRICGYLLTGLLLGPSCLNLLPESLIKGELLILTEAGMSMIAYSIGGSFILERIRRLGRSILTITAFQAVGAFLVPTVLLVVSLRFFVRLPGSDAEGLKVYLVMALLIGAVSVATASGAVLGVISELRASGPFTTALLGVIALSYGLTILLFTFVVTLGQGLLGTADAPALSMLVETGTTILNSLALGAGAALVLMLAGRLVRRPEAFMMIVFGTIFGTSGAADSLGLSGLLANMLVGFLVVNINGKRGFFRAVEQVEEPILGLFFGLGGAHMQLGVLATAGPVALVIVLSRLAGKCAAAWIGASVTRAPQFMKKHLGLGLSPQAGWTIGLVLTAEDLFPAPAHATVLVNAVIGSVIISQLFCLPLVRYSLLKAGETSPRRRVP